jgi:cyclic pyranopterin monophosphate synthase
MPQFSHTDDTGKAKMVDVSEKSDLHRTAKATGKIFLAPPTIGLIKDNAIKKGDVLTVGEIAGIIGAKKTSELIPLCHPIFLADIGVRTRIDTDGITVFTEAVSVGKTGVEMEALVAASVALLTIYDMCKAVDKTMIIGEIKLLEKIKR